MNPDFGECSLSDIIIHYVGNKGLDQNIRFSEEEILLGKDIKSLLMSYFLKPILKETELFTFHHSFDINQNEIYMLVQGIFETPDKFQRISRNLAMHLFECTTHPNIKPGEFYVVHFENIILGDEVVNGIGMFKSESRDTFIKVFPEENGFKVYSDEGININKLDKGALVLNTEKEKGYVIYMVDKTNKGTEAKYWKDDFLNIKPREDPFYHTKNYISLSRDFAQKELSGLEKTEQIDFVNRSVDYFVNNENFSSQDFEERVLKSPEIIESFENFKNEFLKEKALNLSDSEFEISKQAVKQSKRHIRSVLKLDKNFHIYIHGNRENIERGHDETRGMSYYKIYFSEES